jgi:hypothetical protein
MPRRIAPTQGKADEDGATLGRPRVTSGPPIGKVGVMQRAIFGTSTVRGQDRRHRLRVNRRDYRVCLGSQEAVDEIAVSGRQRDASKARINGCSQPKKLAPNTIGFMAPPARSGET